MAQRGIRVAKAGIIDRGADVRIEWVPGHCGVRGNELADNSARGEAARAEVLRKAREDRGDTKRLRQGVISMAFIKGQARKRANQEWEEMVASLNRGRGYVNLQRPKGRIPKIPGDLQRAPKELASRFFQLASGHAMIAPFLREKFGWIDSDMCWWCGSGRQSREHLFKKCRTWKEEIRRLWKEVGEATASEYKGSRRTGYKGRKGFYIGWQGGNCGAGRRPGNTPISMLMADERCIPAILSFLRDRVWQGQRGGRYVWTGALGEACLLGWSALFFPCFSFSLTVIFLCTPYRCDAVMSHRLLHSI